LASKADRYSRALVTNLKRNNNTYLIGGELELLKIKINIQRRWDAYKEDTSSSARHGGRL
jgi:hypothetical protein